MNRIQTLWDTHYGRAYDAIWRGFDAGTWSEERIAEALERTARAAEKAEARILRETGYTIIRGS